MLKYVGMRAAFEVNGGIRPVAVLVPNRAGKIFEYPVSEVVSIRAERIGGSSSLLYSCNVKEEQQIFQYRIRYWKDGCNWAVLDRQPL